MKKLDLSAVTTTIGMPQKSGALTHIQSAYQEAIDRAVRAIIGGSLYDPAVAYILHGCEATGTDPGARTISAGAVFFNGEVYLVDAASFTTAGSEVAVGTITTTYYADTIADPVQFTDGVNRNVHQIRKVVFDAGLIGSGDFDFDDAVDLNYRPQGSIGQVIMWKLPAGTLSDYFTAGLGTHPLTTGWAIADGANGTDNWAGFSPFGYKSGDSDFGAVGATGGAKTVTLVQNQLPASMSLSFPVVPHTGTGVPYGMTDSGGSATPAAITVTNTGGGQSVNKLPPFKTALFIQRIS